MTETTSPLFPDQKVYINHKALCSDYTRGIFSGFSAMSGVLTKKSEIHTLLLGSGAGALAMFIKENIPSAIVHAVDLDKAIFGLGEKYFGLVPDKRIILHPQEATSFLGEALPAKSKFDIIIIDLNSQDLSTGITPDEKFCSKDFLSNIKTHLADQEFMIAINMIFRGNEEKRKAIISVYKEIFDVVLSMKPSLDLNEIFFLIHKGGQPIDPSVYSKTVLNTQIYALQKHFNGEWSKNMNILTHIDTIVVHSPKDVKPKADKKKKKKAKKH